MKAKLIKQNGIGIQTIDGIDYYLILDGKTYHTNPLTSDLSNGGKLSKQNCDEIFGVIDVEKLAEELYSGHVMAVDWQLEKSGFKTGFNKAMELNKDKVFTLDEIKEAIRIAQSIQIDHKTGVLTEYKEKEILKMLQPTEIEVEIEMEYYDPLPPTRQTALRPKLDENGCLILKRI